MPANRNLMGTAMNIEKILVETSDKAMKVTTSAHTTNSTYYLHQPCMYGHIFTWAGTYSENGVPDGIFCECGKFRAKTVLCSECGQAVVKLVPA